MKTQKTTKHDICIKEIYLNKDECINNAQFIDIVFKPGIEVENNNTHAFCIYFLKKSEIIAYSILTPLRTINNFSEKAIFIKDFWCKNSFLQKKLISESVKFSWESGFHAAFTKNTNKTFSGIGFEPVINFTIDEEKNQQLFGMELSWEGFNKITHKLYSAISKN